MKRVVVAELLDSDSGTSEEIASSLADLQRINRWFGGISTMEDLVRKVTEEQDPKAYTMLDVGAATGDIAQALKSHRSGASSVTVTLLDRSLSHLRGNSLFPCVGGDALSLPFESGSFDLVASSLLIHHLEPSQIVRFIQEALRVAKLAVLLSDLRRSWMHYLCVIAGRSLFRSPLTREDAVASVRRSYTPEELQNLVRKAGATRIQLANHYFFRMGVIIWKEPVRTPGT